MHRKIAAAVAVLVLFAGPSTVSFAQNPSRTQTGTNPTAEGIGNTNSTHNPRPQSSGRLEWRTERRPETKWVLILQHTIQPNNTVG